MAGSRDDIVRVVSEVVAPLIGADGGRVYLVRADPENVVLHLAGRYSGCPGNTLTVRRIVEPAIFSVAPNAQVTVTSGSILPEGASLVEP